MIGRLGRRQLLMHMQCDLDITYILVFVHYMSLSLDIYLCNYFLALPNKIFISFSLSFILLSCTTYVHRLIQDRTSTFLEIIQEMPLTNV